MTEHLLSQAPPSAAESTTRARPVVPARSSRRGSGIAEVHLDPAGFWGRRQATNAAATFQHCLDWMERLGWLANFDRVAEGSTGHERPGWQFSDSEVYKLMEGLAWEIGRTGDPRAATMLEQLTERIAAAQDSDGYLNTCFGHPGQADRYSDLEMGHELYCTGHLLQAAVARLRTHGPDRLVDVARRAADEVCDTFGAGGREGICGHPEIELGLVELGRALDEPRYVEQARLFVERRGRGLLGRIPLLGPSYFQDDVPVREADAWRGHAVRALYLSAAAVDVAVDLDDQDLLEAIRRQWGRSVERRTYITGGMGSRHQDEGFGEDWELPADRAYCETCAGIASAMVSWRLYLATGDPRYVDLMERTFVNVLATSPDEAGTAFFYANPLHQRVAGVDVLPGVENPRAEGGTRAPWFDVSCCPTNVARTLASWNTYAVAVDGDTVDLLQYAAGQVRVELGGGGTLALRVVTGYPVDGEVHVEVLEAPERPVTLRLRVPQWATGATLDSDSDSKSDSDPGPRPVGPGWAVVAAVFRPGDGIDLTLPVLPRLTWPDPRIDAVRSCVAVERGPVVLCLESVDLPQGVAVEDVRVRTAGGVRDDAPGARIDAVVVPGAAPAAASGFTGTYRSEPPPEIATESLELPLVPYHQWAQRAPSTMRVFLPTSEERA
ncbi:glycoside hydrolase family 127 protein [Actinotalea sp. BY-33]|uniref:Glycoside hydrolase family 127 protein n=1 Tax=Actinotalea soli TaxID=2819234 RepID=A0A939LU09_9CELL|nr:beta-L-arabinofuranosidase domain-containing protein [Actinotalea soli]MBO1752119.1 glycoside hydrolase family 127 protein [Actinotalea soli]